jgi:hypothetical protein
VVYSGALEVEEGDFILNAQRFIIREDEISFVLDGKDDYGFFIIEGVAKKTPDSVYFAPNCDLKYPAYPSPDKASIRIDSFELSPDRNTCRISGRWMQGDSWGFEGILEKFNA